MWKSYRKYIIYIIVGLVLVSTFSQLLKRNKKLRLDRDAYRNNTEVLLGDIERYKTKSGEDAVRVGELQFRNKELEKYRVEDAALISSMGIHNKELEQLTKIQQQTIYQLRGQARDTMFIEVPGDNPVEIGAKCAKYSDEWLDFSCCIYDDNSYNAEIKSRDRITYVEHVDYARALGFLWRTKRIKSREQTIVNHNPNAEIIDAEFITIRK